MTELHFQTGRDAVYGTCSRVLEFGRFVEPRGQRTKELTNVRLVIRDPWDTMPTGINRAKLNPSIGVLEALQNIAGRSYLPWFKRMVPGSAKWDDDVPTYGERLGDQLAQVVDTLRADPASRQAVAVIWRPDDMVAGQAHNVCTIAAQFLLRGGELGMHVTMRSNDAWWGLCYDLFQFAQVQCTLANVLDCAVGRYVHDAGSMHLYERHWGAAAELEPPSPLDEGEYVCGVGRPGMEWVDVQLRATMLVRGLASMDATESELYYQTAMIPYQGEDFT